MTILTIFVILQATDADPNSSITYSFKEANELFVISNEGQIRVVQSPDDKQAEYRLFIVASDNGVPVLTDCAVAVVTVDGAAAATVTSSRPEADFIIIIVLGVFCGIFLVVIIILLVHIYRK